MIFNYIKSLTTITEFCDIEINIILIQGWCSEQLPLNLKKFIKTFIPH